MAFVQLAILKFELKSPGPMRCLFHLIEESNFWASFFFEGTKDSFVILSTGGTFLHLTLSIHLKTKRRKEYELKKFYLC